MGRQIDRRDHSANRVTPLRERELSSLAASVSYGLPGMHRIRVRSLDHATGNPAAIRSEGAPARRGDYVQRALEHIHSLRPVLGLQGGQPAEFAADPQPQTTSSGAVAVHLQQQYKGLPIFQAAETVRFAPDGAIKETVGSSFTVDQDLPLYPDLDAPQAVDKAARHVAVPGSDEYGTTDQFGEPLAPVSVDLAGFTPTLITSSPDQPDQPAALQAGPFGGPIKASLIWFPLEGGLRLAWEVLMAMPDNVEQYRTLVDAQNGDILYCRQLVQMILARGQVYRMDGASGREMTEFPRPLTDYGLPIPADLPDSFPDHWLGDTQSAGNCVRAHLGQRGPTITGSLQGAEVVFDPSDPNGDDQKVLNIFYYNCFMHDFFYLLNFREADGNFQQENFGRGGRRFDRVDARAHSGAVQGTANMGTPIDGSNPVMNMGLVSSTGRHTAFDSSVVFHEFTHGVSNRLVGGPANARALEADQSGGMGEGWSDYIACTVNDTQVVGDWVVNRPTGIRGFRYDSQFPDHFGKLGSGRYTEVHNIGEIWCATLLEMNRNIGANLGAQLVVDSFKLMPANPSFLDARDAILAALDDKRDAGLMDAGAHATARRGIWDSFAKFGMGPEATSNGATLSGIQADFELPPDLSTPPVDPVPPEAPGQRVEVEARPGLSIPDRDPAGVSTSLTVTDTGRIAALTVSLDIEHTYIGDLRVAITSPSGSQVLLHDRSGASNNDLVTSYSSTDHQGTNALVGEPAAGDWILHLADLATVDIGRLRQWGLEIDLEPSTRVVRGEDTPALRIPDNDPSGVSGRIRIDDTGNVRALRVGVDITHSYIGDLRVELVAPSGRSALLHNRFGASADNLVRSYDSAGHAELAALAGEAAAGEWVLRIVDLAGQDIGKFNRWELELTL